MRLALALFLATFVASPLLAQAPYVPRDERGSLDARAQTTLDGNQVRYTAFNFGQSGRTRAVQDQIPYEWPSGTRRFYLALTGFFVGAEVESQTGERAFIVNVPNYRQDINDPDNPWTWAPVPTYMGGGEIARSDRPETWPDVWPDRLGDADDPGWPGAWNGLLGKDAFIDGVETYVHYTDDGYDRNRDDPSTTYVPDATDPDRAGLGVVVSERRLAFRDDALQDVAFTVRDLYNAGTQDLATVGATVWVADLVGGDADARDDTPLFDDARDLIVFADADGESTSFGFGDGVSVGAVALVLLEAPGDLAFANVQHGPAGGVNFQTVSDETLFTELMAPAAYEPPPSEPADYDTYASVAPFSIDAGDSVRLATALVFGDVDYNATAFEARYAELLRKADEARAFYAGGFVVPSESGPAEGRLALRAVYPNPSSGETHVTFSLPAAQDVRLEVFDALGRRVATLAEGAFPAGDHRATWGGRGGGTRAGSGLYLVRLTAPGGVETRTVVRVR